MKEVTQAMLNLQRVVIDYAVNELRSALIKTYSEMEQQLGNIMVWSCHLALENIANSDALYQDLDHTVMVATAGQAILKESTCRKKALHRETWYMS